MSDELKIAIEAAKKGAKNALRYFKQDIDIEIKGDKTVVSHADKETEEVIKSYVSSKYSHAKFVGEESGGDVHEDEFWTIDPIDGSRNYLRGIPNWCVMVSLCRDGDVFLSVIYYPNVDMVYWGQRGKGAHENDKKLRVSKVSRLEDAYIGFGSIRHFKDKKVVLDMVDKSGSSRGWEPTFGACLVVAGRADVYFEVFGKIWDIAPFKVMLEEAGGKITRLDGTPWTFEGQGALMTNGLLHEEALAVIGGRL
ncbi:MAG: hypothetical protein A2868_01675 [Candidatus Levybacteria bacterium RIFCSPHIGHO2_01_FULL_40_15b]|nr:MAG: hypothetical protein A2868_01675 [Candidatus Levybacteria bacterium RIFCSPHIGHO2_01_FULL_40_15b]